MRLPPPKLIAAAKAKKTPKTTKLPTRIPGTLDLKAIAERDGLRAAATASGLAYSTLWARAKSGKWKVPKQQGQHAKTETKKPKGETTPTRICDSCQLKTQRDPCEHCRTAWKRKHD
jgi:hypothetical protein